MNIIGITHGSPHYAHDTSAVLVSDGEVVAADAEERFSRKKHHSGYPRNAIEYVLKEGGIEKEDVDYVVVPWPNASYFSKLREKWSELKLGEIIGKLRGMRPMRINDNAEIVHYGKEFPNAKIRKIDHELSHASSTYRSSGYNKALIITIDGDGVDKGMLSSGGVFVGNNGEIECLTISPLSGSLGYFYSAVTDELGFKCFDGEGKTMGLAAYGDPGICYDKLTALAPVVDGLKTKGCKNRDMRINIGLGFHGRYDNYFFKYFSNPYLRYLKNRYGHKNLAAAAQKILEDRVIELVSNAVEHTGINKICLAGGVFLNVKANKKVRELPGVKEVFIYPNAGDGGATAGASLQLYHELTGEKTVDKMEHTYLGPRYNKEVIESELRKNNLVFEHVGDGIGAIAAGLITKNKVIGWFQGRAECGPRALGSRSVLADPRDGKMRERINTVLKNRDWFMPFAPSMLEDRIESYVENPAPSPFMIQAFDIVKEKLEEIPAVMHVDGTARVHTVKRNVNERYYDVIDCFQDITGVPLILNTSFNKHGLPIVNTPGDAIEHLKGGCVDVLVIGDFVVYRN